MNTLLGQPDKPTSGTLLRHWRTSRRLKKGDLSLVFFSAMSFISRARDITLQELKIEYFFPADAATEQFARRLAATPETVAV